MTEQPEAQFKNIQRFNSELLDSYSRVTYDQTGNYIAAGDSSGKVWVYSNERKTTAQSENRSDCQSKKDSDEDLYKFYGRFQSHEAGFDYLKSRRISESICDLKWLPRMTESHFLLSSNEKTARLWRMYERRIHNVENTHDEDSLDDLTIETLKVPKLRFVEGVTSVTIENEYNNAHFFDIHSVGLSSDRETFMTADDMRINLWKFENSSETFNVIDLKPENIEDITEVITCANFHPSNGSIFLFASSTGETHLVDMRISSTYSKSARIFGREEFKISSITKDTDIVKPIADFKFLPNENEMVTRQYFKLKRWDMRKGNEAVASKNIEQPLVSSLKMLLENECVFDKFELAVSHDGKSCVTGAYGERFINWDFASDETNAYSYKKGKCVESNLQVYPNKIFSVKSSLINFHPTKKKIMVSNRNMLQILDEV